MKILLTSSYLRWNAGDTIDVDDTTGNNLVAAGHKKMHPDTPARIQYDPDIYQSGCHPNLEALAAKEKK